jgi:hypothetical protein
MDDNFQQQLQFIEDLVGGTENPPNPRAFLEEDKLRYEVEKLRWAVSSLARLLRLHLRPHVRPCSKRTAARRGPMTRV